ncbi:unnamed protein product [Phytophthora fragariaefolia]|uniref:Unnamed protein product n=1 Tax=Phytophthora fragariaefolia TaxID=1490495 RepID=A0A9W6YFB9_9STRA|nr:unnamed protein product [Phytophthora fragariaefolia]
MKESDVVIVPLIRRRIKVERFSDIIVYDATARVQCVLPKRDWISLGVGIHGWRIGPVRDATTPDGVECSPLRGPDNGPASASGLSLPLRERFELKRPSRPHEDDVIPHLDHQDEISSSSSPFSIPAAMPTSNRASSTSQANTVLPRAFLYSPSDIVRLGELGVVTVK